jgi:hypothetical protein
MFLFLPLLYENTIINGAGTTTESTGKSKNKKSRIARNKKRKEKRKKKPLRSAVSSIRSSIKEAAEVIKKPEMPIEDKKESFKKLIIETYKVLLESKAFEKDINKKGILKQIIEHIVGQKTFNGSLKLTEKQDIVIVNIKKTSEDQQLNTSTTNTNTSTTDTGEQEVILLTSKEIDDLPIFDIITQIGQVNDFKKQIIAESNNSLIEDKAGNIVDKNEKVIIKREDIKKLENSIIKNNTIDNRELLKDAFKPAVKAIEEATGKAITFSQLDQMITETKINKEIYNKINYEFNIDFKNSNDWLDILINSILFFKQFNDGLLDIFGILYQISNHGFSENSDSISYNGVVVLKKFVVENVEHKRIKDNIKKYFQEISNLKKIREQIEKEKRLTIEDPEKKKSIFDKIIAKNTELLDIQDKIYIKIEKLTFDQKLFEILLYMYAMIMEINSNTELGLNDEDSKFYFGLFFESLLKKIDINNAAKICFNTKPFSFISQENFKDFLSIDNINNMFKNKDVEIDDKLIVTNELIIQNNTEFNLLLLFSIVSNLIKNPIIKDIKQSITDIINNIIMNQKKNEVGILNSELEEAKKELIDSINFPDLGSISESMNYLYKIVNGFEIFIDNSDKVYIPIVKDINQTDQNILKSFPMVRDIQAFKTLLILCFIEKNKNFDEKISEFSKNINWYNSYINKNGNNDLFHMIYTLNIKNDTAKDLNVEEPKKLDIESIKKELEDKIKNYLIKLEQLQYHNNELSDIIKLMSYVINAINLKFYIKNLLILKNQKISEEAKDIILILSNINEKYINFLKSIFNIMAKKRKDINNLTKSAYDGISGYAIATALLSVGAAGLIGVFGAPVIAVGVGLVAAGGVLVGAYHAVGNAYNYLAGSIKGMWNAPPKEIKIDNTVLSEENLKKIKTISENIK